jgi:Ca2+-binding RTX toxin-like protein
MSTKYQETLKEVLLLNEASKNEAFKLSYAGGGKSGWTFGYQQLDLGGDKFARQTMENILNHEYGKGYYESIQAKVELKRAPNALDKATVEKINNALSGDYAKKQIDYAFEVKLNKTENYINDLEGRLGVKLSFEAKVSIGDMYNQFPPFKKNGGSEVFLKNAGKDGVVSLSDVNDLRKTYDWYTKDIDGMGVRDTNRRVSNIDKVLNDEAINSKQSNTTASSTHLSPEIEAIMNGNYPMDADPVMPNNQDPQPETKTTTTQTEEQKAQTEEFIKSEDMKQTATFMNELSSALKDPSFMSIMVARLAMGEDIKVVSADMATRLVATSAINTYAENNWQSSGGKASLEASTANAIASYAATILITNTFAGGMNSRDYALAAANVSIQTVTTEVAKYAEHKAAEEAAKAAGTTVPKGVPLSPQGAGVVAAIAYIGMKIASDGLPANQEEWEDMAANAASAFTIAYVGAAIGTAIFPGIGTAAGFAIGLVIGIVAGQPLTNYYNSAIDDTKALYHGVSNGMQELFHGDISGVEDIIRANIQFFVDGLERVGHFFEDVGKTVGAILGIGGDDLPPPPPLFKIEQKPDGTGQIVYSLHDGYTIISRDTFADDVVGTNAGETLVGGSGNNDIYAFGGDDFVQAREGNDNIYGGDGNDTIQANAGNDVIAGENGNDNIEAGAGNDTIAGGDGNDTIYGDFASSADVLSMQQLMTKDIQETIVSSGQSYADYSSGGKHAAYAQRVAQASSTVITSVRPDFSEGNDQIDAGRGDDLINAGGGDDVVQGSSGDDIIFGMAGKDVIDGGTGNDAIDGGEGDDILSGGQDGVLNQDANGNYTGYADITKARNDISTFEPQIPDVQSKYNVAVTDLNNYVAQNTRHSVWFGDVFVGSNDIRNQKQAVVNTTKINLDRLTNTVNSAKQVFADIELSGNDAINGGNGNDQIFGFSGNDILNGGEGDDVILGGYGSDTIDGGNGNDTIYADEDEEAYFNALSQTDLLPSEFSSAFVNGDDVINTGSGDDSVFLIEGNDTINLGDGNDTLQNQYANATVRAGSGDDQIETTAGNNIVYGEDGNDTMKLGFGDDKAYGGNGNDNINTGDGNDYIEGNASDDIITSGAGDDTVLGGDGNDVIQDDSGLNTLDGGTGDDYIIGGSDADTIMTGTGNDNVFAGSGDDTIETISQTAKLAGSDGNDTYKVQNLSGNITIDDIGSATDIDTIEFEANKLGSLKMVQNGSDLVISFAGQAGKITVQNQFKDDKTSRIETLKFGDVLLNITSFITGTTGNDKIIGTDIDDTMLGTDVKDVIFGGAGNDFIDGGAGEDAIYGEDGNDVIKGSEDNDIIFGGNGDDVLTGNEGDDILSGGIGKDTFVVTKPGDIDTITDFTVGQDKLDLTQYNQFSSLKALQYFSNGIAQNGSDVTINVDGQTSAILQNQTLANVLQAQNFAFNSKASTVATDGNDILKGTTGNDNVLDGKGSDIMTGGAGNDIFKITQNAGDIDTITDFNAACDKLDLTSANNYVDILQLDIKQKNGDTIIALDDNQKILLENVKAESLLAHNFNFNIFSGLPQTARYSGTFDYDFSQDNVIEQTTSGIAGSGMDTALFEKLIASGIGYNASNLWNSENIWTEGASHVLANNEYYYQTGGKRSQNVLARPTTFNGVDEHDYLVQTRGGKRPQYATQHDNGNDRMYGAWWSETINAGSGNDEVYAGGGDDTVYAGTGNDYVDGGTGNDRLFGESGNDALYGGDGNDYLDGGADNDYLNGGTGNDTLYGGTGSDVLEDTQGNNFLSGQDGNDKIIAGSGNDTIYGGTGNDYMIAGAGNDYIDGGMDRGQMTSLMLSFDATFYLQSNPDVASNWYYWCRPYEHFIRHGQYEGRMPNQYFNAAGYYAINPDVANARMAAWVHFSRHGQYEQRNFDDSNIQKLFNNGNDYIDAGSGDDTVRDMGGNNLVYLGTGNDKATLGDGNDYVDGGDGNDRIYSGGGNDTVVTGSGNDYVVSGAGLDLVQAVSGLNWMNGGAGNDNLQGGIDADIIYGGSGEDTIYGNGGSDLIVAGTNNDIVYGGDASDDISLGQGDDTANGDAGDDLIKGEDGNDIIYGNDGNDSISGGNNDDKLYGNAGNDIISGDTGNDYIEGGDGSDILSGGDGDDKLCGGNGYNVLRGGAGSDVLIFNKNDKFRDVIYGLEASDKIDISTYTEYTSILQLKRDATAVFGSDVIRFANGNQIALKGSSVAKLSENQFYLNNYYSSVKETEANSNAETAYAKTAGFYDNTAITSVDKANWFSGHNVQTESSISLMVKKFTIAQSGANGWNNTLIGNSRSEWLLGGNMDDYINGNDGNDIIDGGTGNDVLYGGNGLDIITSGTGNDLVYGGNDNDIITGNDGNDVLNGDAGNDEIHGNTGNDFVSGGTGNDKLYGEDGDDQIEGNEGDDYIDTGIGNDIARGGLGSDTVLLGAGNDFASGGSGRDYIEGGDGSDQIFGDAGNDKLCGGAGNDYISGGENNDLIYGGDGNDIISGDDGADVLYDDLGDDIISGENGDDVFYIGQGKDTILGGSGRDIFSFESLTSSTSTNQMYDTILDFTQGEDTIDLSSLGINSFNNLSITNDGIDTMIADKNSAFVFKLSGVQLLHAEDFMMAQG